MSREILVPNQYVDRPPRHDRFPWRPTLNDIKTNRDNLERALFWLPRTEADEIAFKEYKARLANEGATIEQDIRRTANNAQIYFCKNPYPYDVVDATHFLLWKLDPSVHMNEMEAYIQQWISRNDVYDDEVVAYENIRLLKSVEAPHWHVFVANAALERSEHDVSNYMNYTIQGSVTSNLY